VPAAKGKGGDDSNDEPLPTLIRLFNEVGRRQLFETVLRPGVTEIQLIYSASSSAAACPGGEAFRFEFSPKGTHLLALLSSRIFVIDLSQREIKVGRELKISRRPVSAAILDDGSILAVLSSNQNVTLYDLTKPTAKIIRSFPLDNEPRAIALSPGAEVLGAAFAGGIEVYSLHPDAGPNDRRAVNCDTVDALAFSPDGTILLGTTLNPKNPTTVIVSAQHFSTDMPVEGLAQLWTTQVLFPRSSRDSSHASLLPGDEDEEGTTWTFTYDRVYETFRAVRVDDLRNGHSYFAGPNNANRGVISPATLPSSTKDGSLVAAGFEGGRVWVYGIPEKLDLPVDYMHNDVNGGSTTSTPERSNSNASRSGARERVRSIVVPQWQVLCDKVRNVFIRGREIGQVSGLSGVKFVMSVDGSERLVAVAGGGVDDTMGECSEEEFFAIGGGRVTVYDFTRGPRVGSKVVIPIEVGDGIQGPVETLVEEQRDIEVEVDIVRRRTVAKRRNAASRQHTFPTDAPPRQQTLPPGSSGSTQARTRPVSPLALASADADDNDEAIDVPYVQGAPRSRNALQRAATVARRAPRTADDSRYARAVGPDGRPSPAVRQRGPPDERWDPPPPPYTPRNNNPAPLPPQLLWSLQGPPRHPEVHMPAPPEPPTQQQVALPLIPSWAEGLERASTTIGGIVRRGSLIRLATGSSSSGISASHSAPVSPAVERLPAVNLQQQYHHNLPFLGIPGNQSPSPQQHPQHRSVSDQRPTPYDIPSVPMVRREHYAPTHSPVPQTPWQYSSPQQATEHYAPFSHGPPPRPSSSHSSIRSQHLPQQPQQPQPQPQQPQPQQPQQPQPPQPQQYYSQQPPRQYLSAPAAPSTRAPSPRRNRSVRRGTALPATYATSEQQAHQLVPPPMPSPRTVSPGNANNSVIISRSGRSVMRRPSRASRSARVNVREAKRKREEKKASKNGAAGGKGQKEWKDKGACVIM